MSEQRMGIGFDPSRGTDSTAVIIERPTALERDVIRAARYFIEIDRSFRGRQTLGTRIAAERLRSAVDKLDQLPAAPAGIHAQEQILELDLLSFAAGVGLGMVVVVFLHLSGLVP